MESDNRIHQETKERKETKNGEWNGKRSAPDLVCADPSDELQPSLGRLFCCSIGLDEQGHALNGKYGSKKAGSWRVDHLYIRIIFFFRRDSHDMMNQRGSLRQTFPRQELGKVGIG
jgi:hypothetical protein